MMEEKKSADIASKGADPSGDQASDNTAIVGASDSVSGGNSSEGVTSGKGVSERARIGRASVRSRLLRRSVTVAMLVAAAMVLSYVESLIPPVVPIPGVKLGLANAVTLFALYALGAREAALISAVRVSLSVLLFGNIVGFIYAGAGAMLSFVMMLAVKRGGLFSSVGVSVIGGVSHNVGQVLAAMAVMRTAGLITYLAPLLISGVVAGAAIGIISGLLVAKVSPHLKKLLR